MFGIAPVPSSLSQTDRQEWQGHPLSSSSGASDVILVQGWHHRPLVDVISLNYRTSRCKTASVISRNTQCCPTEKIPPPALLWQEAVGLSSMAEVSIEHWTPRWNHSHSDSFDQGGRSGTRRVEDHLHLAKRWKLVRHQIAALKRWTLRKWYTVKYSDVNESVIFFLSSSSSFFLLSSHCQSWLRRGLR